MAESRDNLKKEYKHFILNPGSGIELFRTSCLRYLSENVVADCFKLLPIKNVQKDFLEKATKKGDAELQHLGKVFQLFENYAASILAKPWCKDLYTIKVYTGFFKYNIEQWVSSGTICGIFHLIGYNVTSANTLTLKTYSEDQVLMMGFELYLAHTQLCVFKGTEYLSSEYSMKDIMEGWLSTTGNPVNILEWLGKNKLTTKEERELKEGYQSSFDVPDETTRAKSVTIDVKPSYYDKNGHAINRAVKYPPNCITGGYNETLIQGCQNEQHDNSADGNFTSLRTVTISDNQLYGHDDHATSPPPTSGSSSNYLDTRASVSMPFTPGNRNYEHLQNKYLDTIQTSSHGMQGNCGTSYQYDQNMASEAIRKDSLNSNSGKHVVARGGNVERDSGHFYENFRTADKNIHAGKERVDEILTKRISHGENRNPAHSIHGDFDDKQPSQERLITNSISDARNNSNGTDFRPSCEFCGKSAAVECSKCHEIVCQECFDSIFQKRPCINNAEHDDHDRISFV